MTKPKKLSKPGNFGGSKSRTSARGAKSQGIGAASKMEAVDTQDFNDLNEKQLERLFDAYAQATGLANAGERRMLADVMAGGGRQGEFAKNLHNVIMSAPNDVRAKMGESGVYLSGSPKTASEQQDPARSIVDSSSQDSGTEPKSDARYQPLVELGRDMLLAPNPEERNRIRAETNAKRDEIGLSEEEKKGYERAVLSMWAEEAVKAWANDDEKIQKRLDQLVSRLGAEDAAFYEQQLREQRAAFIASGTPEQSEAGTEEVSEEGAEEGELQNEDVVTAEPKEEQRDLTPGEVVSKFAKMMRERETPVEREFNSKSLTEARANLQAIIDANPNLVVNVHFPQWGKSKLSKKDQARMEGEIIAAVDALAQHLKGLPPGYSALLEDIVIKPSKKWVDLTPEEMEARRKQLIAKKPELEPAELQKQIAYRESQFYVGELKQQVMEESRQRVAERLLKAAAQKELGLMADRFVARQGLEGEAAEAKRQEILGSEQLYKEKLEQMRADSTGKYAEEFAARLDEALAQQSVVDAMKDALHTRLKEKYEELRDSEDVKAEAERMLDERVLRDGMVDTAQVDDELHPEFSDSSGAYPGRATLEINPGMLENYGFQEWHATIAHEMGHLKNMAWADQLFSILSALREGIYLDGRDGKKIEPQDLTSDKGVMRALREAQSPAFEAFMQDWQRVSKYEIGKKSVEGKEVSVWRVKEGLDKKKTARLMDTAFGHGYAGGHLNSEDQVMIGVGVREELAEAHRIYSHPKRDEYVAALRASGNHQAADYLTGMFGVIEKYDKLVSNNQVAEPLNKLVTKKAAQKNVTKPKKKVRIGG